MSESSETIRDPSSDPGPEPTQWLPFLGCCLTALLPLSLLGVGLAFVVKGLGHEDAFVIMGSTDSDSALELTRKLRDELAQLCDAADPDISTRDLQSKIGGLSSVLETTGSREYVLFVTMEHEADGALNILWPPPPRENLQPASGGAARAEGEVTIQPYHFIRGGRQIKGRKLTVETRSERLKAKIILALYSADEP